MLTRKCRAGSRNSLGPLIGARAGIHRTEAGSRRLREPRSSELQTRLGDREGESPHTIRFSSELRSYQRLQLPAFVLDQACSRRDQRAAMYYEPMCFPYASGFSKASISDGLVG